MSWVTVACCMLPATDEMTSPFRSASGSLSRAEIGGAFDGEVVATELGGVRKDVPRAMDGTELCRGRCVDVPVVDGERKGQGPLPFLTFPTLLHSLSSTVTVSIYPPLLWVCLPVLRF